LCREDVVAHVGLEAASPAGAHAGLGGEVEAGVGLVDETLQTAAGESDGNELEAGPVAGAAEVGELVGAIVVVVEAVDAEDGVAVGEQRLGELRSDEAGAAGDEAARTRAATAASR